MFSSLISTVKIQSGLADLASDEAESLLSILVDVLLVRVGVIAVAAVRIGGVAVALDERWVVGAALESGWASSELQATDQHHSCTSPISTDRRGFSTYTSSSASADIVGQTRRIVRVAHEDRRLDCIQGITRQRGTRTTAQGIVHDLSALGVSNQDDLGIGAALVQAGHGRDDGRSALTGRLVVGDATTAGLSSAGGVGNGRGLGARVGREDHVDETLGCAVS
jgi:hypothetical protein